jgi:hypothetical protein
MVITMVSTLVLRRHLYEQAAGAGRRRRRMLRKQIRVLSTVPAGPDGGAAGVREPRRPRPPAGPSSVVRHRHR